MPLISYPLQNERREAVRQLIEAFVTVWPGSDFGPAHIALSDYNLDDGNLEFCCKRTSEMLDAADKEQVCSQGYSWIELTATLRFLECLKLIPEDWRDIHAEERDED